MPAAFDQAVKEMCEQSIDQAVKALAAKYGFDVDEAKRTLGELKLERKRGPTPKAKKEKSVKKEAKEPKKPRAKTGYLMFADHVREDVKQELLAELEEGTKLTGKAVVSAIAALWSQQDKETKEEWQARAKALAEGGEDEEGEDEDED